VLVIVNYGSASPAFRVQLLEEAGGRPAEAVLVAPELSSRLDPRK
jgi:hypothetical protein